MGKKILDRALVFGTGASFYSLLETIWRGHTHWSMSLTGGLVLLTVYTAERRTHHTLWRRCLRSAGIITAYEFVVGCLVNLRLGWQVWDYSSQPGNVLGQVCPLFLLSVADALTACAAAVRLAAAPHGAGSAPPGRAVLAVSVRLSRRPQAARRRRASGQSPLKSSGGRFGLRPELGPAGVCRTANAAFLFAWDVLK